MLGLRFGIRPQQRVLLASELITFYQTTHCDVYAENIRWNETITNFKHWWEVIEKKAEDKSDSSKITKNVSFMRWYEDIAYHLNLKLGLRKMPLSHAVRDNAEVDPVFPPQVEVKPYPVKHGYAEAIMMHMESHDHPCYREDNSQACCMLGETSMKKIHESSVKPFQNKK